MSDASINLMDEESADSKLVKGFSEQLLGAIFTHYVEVQRLHPSLPSVEKTLLGFTKSLDKKCSALNKSKTITNQAINKVLNSKSYNTHVPATYLQLYVYCRFVVK